MVRIWDAHLSVGGLYGTGSTRSALTAFEPRVNATLLVIEVGLWDQYAAIPKTHNIRPRKKGVPIDVQLRCLCCPAAIVRKEYFIFDNLPTQIEYLAIIGILIRIVRAMLPPARLTSFNIYRVARNIIGPRTPTALKPGTRE
jgi:hypothetical protein